MRNATVVEKNKALYIREDWESDWAKPIKRRVYWPTGLASTHYQHLIGRKCQMNGTGVARLDGKTHIELLHGSKTTPDPTLLDEKIIPNPKWASEYKYGEWRR